VPKPLPAPKTQALISFIGFDNRAKVEETDLEYLRQVVVSEGSHLPPARYSMLTRDNLFVKVPADQSVEDSLGSCAVDTGRKVGAAWIIVGETMWFGLSLRLRLSLYHTES
jgi:hypothetical protein